MNSVECLQIVRGIKWKTLPLLEKIPMDYDLAAVSFGGEIVVFGGGIAPFTSTYVIDEEGQLIKNLSNFTLTAGKMCCGSTLVQKGRIYAVGMDSHWERCLMSFNSSKWSR